jgi:hypothetical protein
MVVNITLLHCRHANANYAWLVASSAPLLSSRSTRCPS